jgi:DNA-directed DNA polymerase III (polc)
MHYTPLYIKTDNSLLSSLIKIDDLIKFALKNDIKSLTITDDTMYGAYEFYKKCIDNNIKPIIGLEIKIDEKIFILYARNFTGYKELLKINTKKEEKLDIELLKNKTENIILIIPFQNKEEFDELKKYYKYIFVSYKNLEEKNKIKSNPIYMNEINFFNKKEKEYLKYLTAIKEGKLYLNTENTLEESHFVLEESLYHKNNYLIYTLCDLKIEENKNLIPTYDVETGEDAYSYLKKVCIEGLKNKFGNSAPKTYIERLKTELETINEMNFCNYFLIVWDYVKYAKKNNILVGPGRGSAAGSLVSYILDITTIDPIKYNLIFERFLNKERITMPDIDIDFEDLKREDVINYCINKYGNKRVAPVITFGTLKSKAALRDVGRCLDVTSKKMDYLCHEVNSNFDLNKNYKENKKLVDILSNDKELFKVFKIATKIEGLKRHTSIHASAVIMSKIDLDDIIPIYKNGENYITGFSADYLESLGLLKMDFLALTTLTTIHDILDDIEKIENKKIVFDESILEDKETIDIFKQAQTVGIFQFESSGMKSFMEKFKPENFEEISQAIALYRPGPMDNIDDYIKRKRNRKNIDYIHKDLKDILMPTYGIIVYQEQIMNIARVLAGYSYGEADLLRRAMSKKKEDILINEREKFVKKAVEKGYEKEIAEKVYNLILKFASYGFNKAHSVAYSMISYELAYLKAHYPAIFMKNLLNSVIGNEKKTNEYIYESKILGIEFLKPSISISTNEYTAEGKKLLVPLTAIKGIGANVVSFIKEEREKGSFKNIFEFFGRCYSKNVNKAMIENLIHAGALKQFGINQKTLIDNLDILINYAEIAKDLSYEFALKPELKTTYEFTKKEISKKELELFGFYLSDHPITEYNIKYKDRINIKDIPSYFDKNVKLIVYVKRINEISTKKGEKMCFITGTDEVHVADLVLFPKVYEKYKFGEGSIIYLNGKVEKRFDKYQIIVNDFKILE